MPAKVLDGDGRTTRLKESDRDYQMLVALNSKAIADAPIEIADVTGLQAELDGKADDVHSHVIADTTGLQAALDTKGTYTSGTWTPVLTFATPGNLVAAYTTQTGIWVRIGALLICKMDIVTSTFTHTTASGALTITGLPVTVVTAFRSQISEWQGITKAGYSAISALASGTQMTIRASGSAQAAANIGPADMPTGGTVQLRGIIMYLAATGALLKLLGDKLHEIQEED